MKTFPKKTLGPGGFRANSIEHLRKKNTDHRQAFSGNGGEDTLPHSLSENSIKEVSKPNKHQKRKSLADISSVH